MPPSRPTPSDDPERTQPERTQPEHDQPEPDQPQRDQPEPDTRPDVWQRADFSAAAVRTRLAWRRTTLTGTVAALLLLRLALVHGDRLALAISGLVAFYWLLLLVVAQRRIRALPTTSGGSAPIIGRETTQLAVGTLAFASAGLILTLS